MNHPNPSNRTHATGVPPVVNPGLSAGAPHDPNMRNEPNSRPPGVQPPPIWRNEPNLPHRHRHHHHAPENAKRTQFPHTKCPANTDFSETNPISPGEFTKQTQFPHTKCPTVPQLRETNPILPTATIPTAKKCETNPISPAADLWRANNAKRTQSHPGKCAKRTQFAPPPLPHPPKNAKRTQFHPAARTSIPIHRGTQS